MLNLVRWTDLADDCLRKQPTTVIYITDKQVRVESSPPPSSILRTSRRGRSQKAVHRRHLYYGQAGVAGLRKQSTTVIYGADKQEEQVAEGDTFA